MPDLRAGTTRPPDPTLAAAITTALRHAHDLATEQPRLLVHGDLHLGNVMLGGDGPKAIDPHGLAGDPAYDFLPLLRNDWHAVVDEPNLDRAIQRRIDAFADAAVLDRDRVRRWAQLRGTISAHWLREVGGEPGAIAIVDTIAIRLATDAGNATGFTPRQAPRPTAKRDAASPCAPAPPARTPGGADNPTGTPMTEVLPTAAQPSSAPVGHPTPI